MESLCIGALLNGMGLPNEIYSRSVNPAESTDPSPETSLLEIRSGSSFDLPEVRRLLHRTFVAELAQHADTGRNTHRDKFEHKNHLYLAREDGELQGLIAVHGEAPFSVAARLPDGVNMQDIAERPLEVRLLCVARGRRHSRIALHLMAAVFAHARAHGFHELWISGVNEQLSLYRKLGFEALGPAIPDGKVAFTPMRARLEQLPPALVRLAERTYFVPQPPMCSLLPGPARLNLATRRAAASQLEYHRGSTFLNTYRRVQGALSHWMGGHGVAVFPGGGTHANDVLAQTLRHLPDAHQRPGIILCNGEFGNRLVAHARGVDLPHQVLDFGWGEAWNLARLKEQVHNAKPAWIWAVHCESSSGMLNPIADLSAMLDDNTALCLDAISTLGALRLPQGVAFASAVSGKALQSLPGIAVVSAERHWFAQLQDLPWPPSMDLSAHFQSTDPPHTLGYPTLAALDASLSGACRKDGIPQRTEAFKQLGLQIRRQLIQLGVRVLAPEEAASPVMTTFEVPSGMTTAEFLSLAQTWGYQLAGHSTYLAGRHLAQIATYGEFEWKEIAPLFRSWRAWSALKPRLAVIHRD